MRVVRRCYCYGNSVCPSVTFMIVYMYTPKRKIYSRRSRHTTEWCLSLGYSFLSPNFVVVSLRVVRRERLRCWQLRHSGWRQTLENYDHAKKDETPNVTEPNVTNLNMYDVRLMLGLIRPSHVSGLVFLKMNNTVRFYVYSQSKYIVIHYSCSRPLLRYLVDVHAPPT